MACLLIAFGYHAAHRGHDATLLVPEKMRGIATFLVGNGGNYVHLFFMLSGFVMYYNYRKKIEQGQIDLQEFVFRRFSRLYPSAWAANLVTAAIMIFYQIKMGAYPFSRIYAGLLYDFVLSLLFLNTDAVTMNGPSFDPVLWTASYEMIMYLLFFFLATKSGRKNGLLFYVLPVFAGLLAVNGRLGEVGTILTATGFSSPYAYVLIDFFIGCILAELYFFIEKKKCKAVVGYITVLLSIIVPIVVTQQPQIVGNALGVYQLVWFPSLILSVLCIKWLFAFLSVTPFQWLGKLSFAIYIWHLPVYDLVELPFLMAGRADWTQTRKFYFLWIAVSLLFSFLSYQLLECRLQRWMRNNYRRSREHREAQTVW